MPSAGPQPKSLEIRFRQILSGDGEASSRPTVYCPQRCRSLDLPNCLNCYEFVEMRLDPGEQTGVLKCHPDKAPTSKSSAQDAFKGGSASSAGERLATLADNTSIAALMSGNVQCVREDVGIQALATLLIEGGFTGVPVVDEDGEPIGVVTEADLVRHHYIRETASDRPPSTVGDIMTGVSFTLNEGASIAQAAAVMSLGRVHRIPVVDSMGQVVGILSSLDVLYWLACETDYVVDVVRSFLSNR
jgi:CBS domain-containing protein